MSLASYPVLHPASRKENHTGGCVVQALYRPRGGKSSQTASWAVPFPLFNARTSVMVNGR